MGVQLTRRDFISGSLIKKVATTAGVDPGSDDPFFKKYANREMPFSAVRTESGLNPYGGTWSDAETLHLLRRTCFGTNKASVEAIRAMSPAAAVNFLIDNPQYPASSPLNVYENEYHDLQGCPFGISWIEWAGSNDSDAMLNAFRIKHSFKQWWLGQLINQQNHILEKISLFWANHFSTQTEDFNFPKAIWKHYKKIREGSLGNFRTLLKEITIDPHMLVFLNGNLNSASAPDENYARELQELFTVGKGPASAYTEDDVKQAAKILTGWRRQEQADGFYTTVFDDNEHDSTDKQFSSFYNNTLVGGKSGQNGQTETDALLDMILATDEAAKYICRCLYRWFVYYVIDDAAEQNVIAPLAEIFRSNNYEIVPVLKALFTSEHFFDPVNRGCIIKSPVDYYIGFCREFQLDLETNYVDVIYSQWDHFWAMCNESGQNPGDPPSVAGWHAYYQEPVFYEAWINSDTVQKRARVMGLYTSTGYPIGGTLIKSNAIRFTNQFEHPEDPNEVVANFCKYLLPQPLTIAQTTYLKQSFLLTGQINDNYWTKAWNDYIADPTDPVTEGTIGGRLDKLINYITNMEEYQLY
ncbi:MAG: DUF1800 domain-containing protein [Bacteroidota bacterium]